MAASDEWQLLHLTPGGWVDGGGKYDFTGVEGKPVPVDAVLTVKRHVYVGAIGAAPKIDESEMPSSKDQELIQSLLQKYGKPVFSV